MEARAGEARVGSANRVWGLWAFLALAAMAVVAVAPGTTIAPVVALGVALLIFFSLTHKWLLEWRRQVGLLMLVILFIPIQLYSLGGGLPFQLEPYRILVALMFAAWLISLLIDPRVGFRRTGLEGPILLILASLVFSELANTQRISALQVHSEVTKSLTFAFSFFLIVYFVVGVVRTRADVERLIEILCAGGGVLGIFAVIEYRTHYDFFFHLHSFVPFLKPLWGNGPGIIRGGDTRVFASAQHPIALGGLFAILLPLAIYLALRPGKRIWWVVAGAVTIGAVSSVSRTSMVMLAGVGLAFLFMRPRQTLRAWPLLVPAVLVIQFAVPGALRSVQNAFFPAGGLIAQQSSHADYTSKNRLSRWGPTLKEWERDPLFGEGYATRQPVLHPETFVLDDQWLKTLVETGILGVLGWVWLFGRSVRRLTRRAKEEAPDGGWLEVSLAASIISFAIGMWFYDTFSFIQVTVMLLILVALSAALVQADGEPRRRRASVARWVRGRRLTEVEPELLA
jgi:polysaccharide biosynthesis protein PslJ